jgi:alpha-tubulin suppressor-like RCC1 family protein
VNTELSILKGMVHLKIKELRVLENTLFILSTDGMVYRWGSLNSKDFEVKPQPVLGLIDFTVKSISVSEKFALTVDS